MQAANEEQIDKTQANLSKLSEIKESMSEGESELRAVKRMLSGLNSVEIANLLSSSPPKSRQYLWDLIDPDSHAEVIQELPEDVAIQFVKAMDSRQVAELTESIDVDDVADILQKLPEQIMHEILLELKWFYPMKRIPPAA
jgi:magnesium transporter